MSPVRGTWWWPGARWLALVLFASLTVAACASDPDSPSGDTVDSPTSTHPDPGDSDSSAVEPSVGIVDATAESLEDYWATEMPQVAPTQYAPVTRWTPYTDNNLPRGACGDASPQNAAYCPSDDSIEYSTDWLSKLDADYSRTGTMGTVVILAHEFGHHVSDLHGRPFHLGVGKELQADCYAGVFLDGASKGSYSLLLEDGDVADALETLANIADDPDFLWSNPKAHGGPQERRAAMARGWISGDPDLCAAYEATDQILVRQFGEYALRLPPAASVEELANGSQRVSTTTEPEYTTDLSAVSNVNGATATEMLTGYADTYFEGSEVTYLIEPESFNALPAGMSAANVLYEQVADTFTAHGVLLLVTKGDGTALLIDTYADGRAPAGGVSGDSWHDLGNFAFSALWGVS